MVLGELVEDLEWPEDVERFEAGEGDDAEAHGSFGIEELFGSFGFVLCGDGGYEGEEDAEEGWELHVGAGDEVVGGLEREASRFPRAMGEAKSLLLITGLRYGGTALISSFRSLQPEDYAVAGSESRTGAGLFRIRKIGVRDRTRRTLEFHRVGQEAGATFQSRLQTVVASCFETGGVKTAAILLKHLGGAIYM